MPLYSLLRGPSWDETAGRLHARTNLSPLKPLFDTKQQALVAMYFFLLLSRVKEKTRKKRRSIIAVETASRNWWEVLPLSRRAVDRRHSAEPPEQHWAGWCLSDGICVKYSALHGINVSEKPSQPSIKGQIIIKILFFSGSLCVYWLEMFFFFCVVFFPATTPSIRS